MKQELDRDENYLETDEETEECHLLVKGIEKVNKRNGAKSKNLVLKIQNHVKEIVDSPSLKNNSPAGQPGNSKNTGAGELCAEVSWKYPYEFREIKETVLLEGPGTYQGMPKNAGKENIQEKEVAKKRKK